MQETEDTSFPVGFHNKNGTLREYLRRGYEIKFEKDGTEYNLDNGILTLYNTGEILLNMPGKTANEILRANVNGITVEELIETSHVLALH